MQDHGRRSLLGIALCISLISFLSACDLRNNQLGPISFTTSAGEFRLAVCADVQAQAIEVVTSQAGVPREFTDWWKAQDGSVPLVPGSVLETDDLPEMFGNVQVRREPLLDGVSTLSVVVEAATRPTDNIVAVFPLPDGAPWERAWLHPDGRLTDEPCE